MTSATNGSPQLSVAMIVRDASGLLETTLDSVRAIADQIVVVDTGSTDATAQIAERGADLVVRIEWQDSFAAARNECLRHVSGQWVLWLDAGETIDDMNAQQLRGFVDETADVNKAYMLFVQRPVSRFGGDCEQIGQLRLIPNRSDLEYRGRVRESLLPSLRAAGMGVDAIDCRIQRDAGECDPQRRRARALRNLNLVNLSSHEGPENLQLLLCRAESLGQLGRWNEANTAYRAVLARAERDSQELLEAHYGLLTALDALAIEKRDRAKPLAPPNNRATCEQDVIPIGGVAESDEDDERLSTCLNALECFPLDAQLLCEMGSCLSHMRRLDLAARTYELAANHGTVTPTTWHLADVVDLAIVRLAQTYQSLGDGSRAEQTLGEALAKRRESLRLRRKMIEHCVESGRELEAIGHCRALSADAPFRSEMPLVVRGAILAAGGNAEAAIDRLRPLYDGGCRDPLCLRWLALAYLAEGKIEAASRVTLSWAEVEPENQEIEGLRQAIDGRRDSRENRGNGPQNPAAKRRFDGKSPGPSPVDATRATPRSTTPEY